MTDRRKFLQDVAKGIVVVGAGSLVPGLVRAAGDARARDARIVTAGLAEGTNEAAILDALPGKRPLIKRTFRPANYETPLEYFDQAYTPNDAFFVRYHLGNVPEVSRAEWKLEIAALTTTPDFVKSIPVWKALDENTLLAWEMNGEPLPHWNGFPVRLVVPGWTATYWTKQIASVRVVSQPFKGFWMATGYRIPKGKFALVDRFLSQETETNTPITEMVVGSLVTNLRGGEKFRLGQRVEVRGIAWDGGYGMQGV